MLKNGERWTRDELIAAFYLYFTLPFGKLHRRNPDIIRFAEAIRRTPNAVAMKLVNYASLDERHQKRGVKGLSNVSKDDRAVFEEFCSDWTNLVLRAAHITETLMQTERLMVPSLDEVASPDGPSERIEERPVRILQSFFRKAVLSAYQAKCAICGVSHEKFLNASHIIPWSANEAKRADPTNGLCLCVLHDRAFDKGFISVGEDFKLLVSRFFNSRNYGSRWEEDFGIYTGKVIILPKRLHPSAESLSYHLTSVFQD